MKPTNATTHAATEPISQSIDIGPWLDDPEIHAEVESAREVLQRDLDKAVMCRPIPKIAMQILEASRQFDLKTVVSLVEIEPAYCVNLLTLANSPLYGHTREISSVQQAIVLIGFNNLNKLILSMAAKDVFTSDSGNDAQMAVYEHSLACAAIGQTLASRHRDAVDTNAAFLAGMLHDVGKLVLFDLAPQATRKLQSMSHDGAHVRVENQLFGTDHTSLGCRIGETWALPRVITDSILQHHSPHSEVDSIPAMIALANQLAHRWDVDRGVDANPDAPNDSPVWSEINGEPEDVLEESQEKFQLLKSLFMN